jgi:hypothetical protein
MDESALTGHIVTARVRDGRDHRLVAEPSPTEQDCALDALGSVLPKQLPRAVKQPSRQPVRAYRRTDVFTSPGVIAVKLESAIDIAVVCHAALPV